MGLFRLPSVRRGQLHARARLKAAPVQPGSALSSQQPAKAALSASVGWLGPSDGSSPGVVRVNDDASLSLRRVQLEGF